MSALYCSQCGTRNRSNDNACHECGARFADHAQVDCPLCGIANPRAGAFCLSCGAHLLPPQTGLNRRAENFLFRANILQLIAADDAQPSSPAAPPASEPRAVQRIRELSAIFPMATKIKDAADLQTVFSNSLARIFPIVGADIGFIHVRDKSSARLTLAATRGLPRDLAEIKAALVEIKLPAQVVETREPLTISDITQDARTARAGKLIGAFSYVCVPVSVGENVLGTVSILREGARAWSDHEVEMLFTTGALLGIAIETARGLEDATHAAILQERTRLAHDLHDSLTQSLYSQTLLASAARRFAEAGDLDKATANLMDLSQVSQDTLKEMRLFVYELRPPTLEKGKLVEALEQRLGAVEKRAGIQARLVTQGTLAIPAEAENDLFLIAIEALNNSLKHAAAQTVILSLRGEAQSLELRISDDGTGFEIDRARGQGGVGLTSMAERARRIGARFDLRSNPGKGTQVSVTLPRQTK
ncbi:MAG: GAF domain-containing protein [Chloroflexi bacterium]|nr:GAF domain-containing protein [Chloroflexota bacterium]